MIVLETMASITISSTDILGGIDNIPYTCGSDTSEATEETVAVSQSERIIASARGEERVISSIENGCKRVSCTVYEQRKCSNTRTISFLLLLATLLTTIQSTFAQTDTTVDPERLCSCSPREFFFKLNLTALCPPLPPPFPPNTVFGSGVKDYTCTIGPEPSQSNTGDEVSTSFGPTLASLTVENPNEMKEIQERKDPTAFAQHGATIIPSAPSSGELPDFPTGDSGVTDFVPVVIDSIQFIEVDTSFNVINQDPAYVRGADFENGTVFNYTSVAMRVGTNESSYPGGMNMVLRGINAEGERIRNVFTITYSMDCDEETFRVGDAIGWVIFEDFLAASDQTCDATKPTMLPTLSPTTSPPSMTPTRSPFATPATPTDSPVQMSFDYLPRPPTHVGSGGKSGKQGKSGKSSKSAKSHKSSKHSPRFVEPLRQLRSPNHELTHQTKDVLQEISLKQTDEQKLLSLQEPISFSQKRLRHHLMR